MTQYLRKIAVVLLGMVALLAGCCIQRQSATAPASGHSQSLSNAMEESLQSLACQQYHYRCSDMVQVVNGLRHLGKERALDRLQLYHDESLSTDRFLRPLNMICVCMLLFKPPPGGWDRPWHAPIPNQPTVQQEPEYGPEFEAAFPLYPIALVDDIPFLLTYGYSGPGGGTKLSWGDEAQRYLDRCRMLDLIAVDLSTSGFARAAMKLLRSSELESFMQTYDVPDRSKLPLVIIMEAIDDRVAR